MKRLFAILISVIFMLACSVQSHATTETQNPQKETFATLTSPNATEKQNNSSYTPQPTEIKFNSPQSPTPDNKILYKSSTPVPTITQTTISQTSTQTISTYLGPNPIPNEVTVKCLEILSSPPQKENITGKIVLKGHDEYPNTIFEINTGNEISMPDAIDMAVSTDGKWLAYVNTLGERDDWVLNLVNDDLQIKNVIPWGSDWFSILQWLDNEWLIITRKDETIFTTILLNPFNGKYKELPYDYPGIYTDYPRPMWGDYKYSVTIYNQFLDRVIYPLSTGIALWDLTTNKQITLLTTRDYWGGIPKWAPDGKKFVIKLDEDTPITVTSANELYSISSDGVITRLTYLSNQYTISAISEYSWSPDGRYVAFWMIVEPETTPNESLAVLDMVTKKITNYCVPGMDSGFGAHEPIWSPNGLQLAVENIQNGGIDIRVILVDILQEWAAVIGENRTPVGWMVSP